MAKAKVKKPARKGVVPSTGGKPWPSKEKGKAGMDYPFQKGRNK